MIRRVGPRSLTIECQSSKPVGDSSEDTRQSPRGIKTAHTGDLPGGCHLGTQRRQRGPRDVIRNVMLGVVATYVRKDREVRPDQQVSANGTRMHWYHHQWRAYPWWLGGRDRPARESTTVAHPPPDPVELSKSRSGRSDRRLACRAAGRPGCRRGALVNLSMRVGGGCVTRRLFPPANEVVFALAPRRAQLALVHVGRSSSPFPSVQAVLARQTSTCR